MHEDAIAAGNLVVTIGDVRRDGIAHAIDRALDHVAHCEAMVVDCDIDVIDRSQFPARPGAGRAGWRSHDFFHAVRRLAADRRVRADRPDRMGPAARSDRPQRFDRGALGRRVPCRVRDALALGDLRCGGSGTTTTSLRRSCARISHGIRRPFVLAVSRSMKLPGPHISATTRPSSQCTSCTRPSVSPSRVVDLRVAKIGEPHHIAPAWESSARTRSSTLVQAELFGRGI